MLKIVIRCFTIIRSVQGILVCEAFRWVSLVRLNSQGHCVVAAAAIGAEKNSTTSLNTISIALMSYLCDHPGAMECKEFYRNNKEKEAAARKYRLKVDA